MYPSGQALLNFCMQTDVMHHMCEICLTRREIIDHAQSLKNSLMTAVRFRIAQGIDDKHLHPFEFLKFTRFNAAHVSYISQLAESISHYWQSGMIDTYWFNLNITNEKRLHILNGVQFNVRHTGILHLAKAIREHGTHLVRGVIIGIDGESAL